MHRVEGLARDIHEGAECHRVAFAGTHIFHRDQFAQHPIMAAHEMQHLRGHQLAAEPGLQQVEPSQGDGETVKLDLVVGILQGIGTKFGELEMLVLELEERFGLLLFTLAFVEMRLP